MSGHEWRPLGFRRTIAFLLSKENAVASWRFGKFEIEIEKTAHRRFPTSVYMEWPRSAA